MLLSRLTRLAGRPCEIVQSGLALAQHQQQRGLFSAAHSQLLETLLTFKRTSNQLLQSAGIAQDLAIQQDSGEMHGQLYARLLHRFALIHCYLLVPEWLKRGGQYNAALLLIRASDYFEE